MKKLILAVIIASILATIGISFGRSDDANYIDVKIGDNHAPLDRVKLSSEDGLFIYQKDQKEEAMMELPGSTMYISLSLGSHDEIDVYDNSNTYITTLPANGKVLFGGDVEDYLIEVDGKTYRGYITFIGDRNGVKVINHIDIEKYLYGVVPKEIPPMSGQEALKAQAVAARSYTLSGLDKHISEGFNVCDTTHCQAYGGYDSEHENTSKAVDDTIGLVVIYDGNIANTVFHSSSGGYTESSENIWGGRVPYLIGKEDKYSLNSVNSTWVVELDTDIVSDRLNNNGENLGDVENIDIIKQTDSGRALEILVTGSRGDSRISGEKFRALFGNSTIKSTLFSIEGGFDDSDAEGEEVYVTAGRRINIMETNRGTVNIISNDGEISNNRNNTLSVIGDREIKSFNTSESVDISRGSVVISGSGYGHGIGMSQYGAIEMSKQGYDFEEILKYYYTDIEILKY